MKITDVKTVVVNAQMRNWVFVKVETDQPGLFGWGEASLEWKTRAVVGAGAVVMRNVHEGKVVSGNPAREIGER